MVKQILSDAAQQARNLARQTSEEILKEPGKIAQEAARSTGLSPEAPQSPQFPQPSQSPPLGEGAAAQLASARAKIRSFAQRRAQEWQKPEIQAVQAQQKRVQQIVETQLGHAPQGQPGQPEGPKEKAPPTGGQGSGVLGALADFFKGKKSRKLGVMGLGQAKKQASGEFGKSQQ